MQVGPVPLLPLPGWPCLQPRSRGPRLPSADPRPPQPMRAGGCAIAARPRLSGEPRTRPGRPKQIITNSGSRSLNYIDSLLDRLFLDFKKQLVCRFEGRIVLRLGLENTKPVTQLHLSPQLGVLGWRCAMQRSAARRAGWSALPR